MICKKAPAFTLPDQDGKTHKLVDYKGKNVVLFF
jgi:peroxiredoxin